MPFLRCQIVRYLSEDPFPGWVEARLIDLDGRAWLFHDKPPLFTTDALVATTPLPVDGTIDCEVIAADGATVTVDTSMPSGIEATDGTTTFVVGPEQLIDYEALRKERNSPRIARAHFDDPPCPDCLGSGERDTSTP